MPPKKPRKNNKNKRRRKQNSSALTISRPLLPQTQKVGMRYTTRFTIDPAAIKSDLHDAANLIQTYSLAWNNLYDVDQTSNALFHAMEGSRNHQPRMYDQYATFYDMNTVIGAKAKITFTAMERIVATQTKNAAGAVTGSIDNICDPLPCYVGYLNSSFADNSAVSVKIDDVIEQKQAVVRKLVSQDKPVTLNAKWSINKEPSRRYDLELETGQSPGYGWGTPFGHDLVHTYMRHLHLFAHPLSTQETRSGHTGFDNPGPVDVAVEMDFICVLSGRKDVAKST